MHTSPTRLRRGLAAAAVLGMMGLAGVLGVATPASAAEPAFPLADDAPPLGMATDHVRDRYWVLTRSQGVLTLHAYASDGYAEGAMSSRDRLTDAQAVAFVDGEAYVGDIGGARAEVRIYRVTEPWPGTEINKAPVHTLAYPDGEHAAAALLVNTDRRFFVATTGESAGLYAGPEDAPAGATSPLTRVADVPDGVTDGTVLVDGRLVLRTASELLTLDPDTYGVLGRAPVDVEEVGWALTQTVDEKALLTGAGADGALSRFAVPGPAPTQPTATPTRAPARPPVVVPDEEEPVRRIAQTGTTTAIVAGLAVAALAAAVVLVRR